MLRHPLDDPMPDAPCECKYRYGVDAIGNLVTETEECFRCSVKRTIMEKNKKRFNRLWLAYWIVFALAETYLIGEALRWWG
jgi:predicted nucleic acid-binding Zn ribbon protein